MAGRPLTTVSRPTSGLESTPTPTGPTFTIDAIADQSDLSQVTLGVTVTASTGSLVYSWTVDGAATGLDDATAAAPTYTPTTGGKHTVACTITDDGGTTVGEPVAFQVGHSPGFDPATYVDMPAEPVTNVKTAGSVNLGGQVWTVHNGANATSMALDGSTGLAIVATGETGVKKSRNHGLNDHVRIWAVVAGTIGAGKVFQLKIANAADSRGINAHLWNNGGTYTLRLFDTITGSWVQTSTVIGATQPTVWMVEYLSTWACRIWYSTAPYSGTLPDISAMTSVSADPDATMQTGEPHTRTAGSSLFDAATDLVYLLTDAASLTVVKYLEEAV